MSNDKDLADKIGEGLTWVWGGVKDVGGKAWDFGVDVFDGDNNTSNTSTTDNTSDSGGLLSMFNGGHKKDDDFDWMNLLKKGGIGAATFFVSNKLLGQGWMKSALFSALAAFIIPAIFNLASNFNSKANPEQNLLANNKDLPKQEIIASNPNVETNAIYLGFDPTKTSNLEINEPS